MEEGIHYESLSRHPSSAGVSQPAFKKNTIKTYHSILSKLTCDRLKQESFWVLILIDCDEAPLRGHQS